jgi:transposase
MAPHADTPGAHHRRDPELRRAFARSSAVLLRDIAGAVHVRSGWRRRLFRVGHTDARGPISKHGPKYLRWALFEAALNACKHPYYAERYQHTKRRLGRQRGPKVAQIDLARRLTEAIWHMLTNDQPFAPAGALFV